MAYKIAVIPGDGTGPEVVNEGLKVLKAVAEKEKIKFDFGFYDIGGDRYLKTGETLPDSVLDELKKVQAIFLGPWGIRRFRPESWSVESFCGYGLPSTSTSTSGP